MSDPSGFASVKRTKKALNVVLLQSTDEYCIKRSVNLLILGESMRAPFRRLGYITVRTCGEGHGHLFFNRRAVVSFVDMFFGIHAATGQCVRGV